MQQYFSNKREKDILYMKKEDIFHIKNVMRMKEKTKIIVNFENISYGCELSKNLREAKILDVYKETKKTQKIIAFIPLLREEKFKYMLQKSTELNINEIYVVEFQNCTYKLEKNNIQNKLERWSKIIKEASEQNHRIDIPVIKDVISVNQIYTSSGVNILCSLDKQNVKVISDVLSIDNCYDTISIVFGPEGGITESEELLLSEKGFIKTKLSDDVLRSETVIVYLLSIISYLRSK